MTETNVSRLFELVAFLAVLGTILLLATDGVVSGIDLAIMTGLIGVLKVPNFRAMTEGVGSFVEARADVRQGAKEGTREGVEEALAAPAPAAAPIEPIEDDPLPEAPRWER